MASRKWQACLPTGEAGRYSYRFRERTCPPAVTFAPPVFAQLPANVLHPLAVAPTGNCTRGAAVIDLTTEEPIPLTAAAKLIPPGRSGRRTHLSTLLRWINRGARGPGGTAIRLEAIRLGGRWLTSRAALQRFADRLTPTASDEPMPAPRTPGKRQRDSERAAARLTAKGI